MNTDLKELKKKKNGAPKITRGEPIENTIEERVVQNRMETSEHCEDILAMLLLHL